MLLSHPDFSARIETLVAEIERSTDAELVVVAARRSGSYRDLGLLAGVAVALVALGGLLFAPLEFHPLSVPIYVLGVGALAAWTVGRSPALLRRLARPARCRRQVEDAARVAFVEEAVHGTRARTGILVYVSEAERRCALVRDLGLDGRIPGAAWTRLDLGVHDLASFEALLRAVGAVLAAHLPARADNPNELPDAPRVRP